MAAVASSNITMLGRAQLGNRVLVTLKTVGTGTTFTAKQAGLQRIDVAWTQSVDEAAGDIAISAYAGSSITFATLTAGDYNIFYLIGY
jgi:hypothetical protein